MVKVDYKRDYYADLELPSTADQETIKKHFRELAKQYHPDRNPGREVDVVPKFQAIQAANEILGDPVQKAKYDAERAKLNRPREAESPTFRKPAPPRRTDSGYANGTFAQPNAGQAPHRDASASRYAPQNAPRSRPPSATSTGADKFAQFARAAPQQWDRSRYEEAARAEGLRGMNAMRGAQVPPTPPLSSRAPTAPKTANADPYSSGPDPAPGFPGLGRTASQRKGFGTHASAGDEPASHSAYAHYRRDRERPPSTGGFYGAESPSQQKQYEPGSPLRPNRSFQPDTFSQVRPDLSRQSSRYARTTGERTELNTGNVNRSASVRNSPIGRRWEERGPFGAHSSTDERTPRPRHRSHSPSTRKSPPTFEYASETSSDEDDLPPPRDRKKAALRRPHTMFDASGEAPGLTGYYPNTNYTRVVDDHGTYDYPAPEMKSPPVRKPFANMTSPLDAHDHSANEPPFRSSSEEDALRHNSSSSPEKTTTARPKFSAEEWHEHFDNHADLFNPPETMTRDRKSPAKNTRSRGGTSRTFVPTKDSRQGADGVRVDPTIAAGARHVDPQSVKDKSLAFQSGQLGADFADKVNGTDRASHTRAAEPQPSAAADPAAKGSQTNGHQSTVDEMDVDSPTPADSETGESAVHVTVEEEQSPSSTHSHPSPNPTSHRAADSRRDGFNLEDLKSAGPFTASSSGLKDLGDLANSLPFQSRPAETMETLHPASSSTLRHLNLPRPPTQPRTPTDAELDQRTWTEYGDAMQLYMHEWMRFNAAMIEHFTARQQAVTHGMWRNWVCAQGDGPSAEEFESSGGHDRAGYAAYMTWLDDDKKCRTWWDMAFEDHRVTMEGLGRVRRRVKELSARAKR